MKLDINRHRMGCGKNIPFLLMLLFLLAAPVHGQAKDEVITPLFPIELDHEFPRPAETFEEVKDLILNQYYHAGITEETLYWSAIEGMLRHISPPENPELSKLWIPDDYEKISDSLKGMKLSLGMKSTFNPTDGSLTVTEISPGSPADHVLRPYDRILRIDEKILKGLSLKDVHALLEGEEGATVSLTVNRDIKIFDLVLTFDKFKTEKVAVTRLTDKIALVEIKYFTSGTSQTLKGALEGLSEDGVEGLIIDLRNNSGGVFIESLRTVELFLPEKHILVRTFQRQTQLQNYTSSNNAPFLFDIAILVNERTASSSEILAAALKDHRQALVIGTRTYGKAVFEKTFTLKNDCRVKFITGAMYSPEGKNWQAKGIAPDFLIEQDDATISALLKIPPKKRLLKDAAMITAFKLLTR
jgi:carboxyl-terminal processing protease